MADMATAGSFSRLGSLSTLRLWTLRRSLKVAASTTPRVRREFARDQGACALDLPLRKGFSLREPWQGLVGRGQRVVGFDAGRETWEGGRLRRALCVVMENIMGLEEEEEVEGLDTVRLTELEEKIFDVLIATLKHFGLSTELRVAGGWVRDKLLGKDSADIDIALDNMLGKDFCEKVNDYLKSIGESTTGVGVIQSNPEQSKHLETATMKVKGVFVDFVNLRAETYANNSRIPTMEFGTAEQDAFRRDLTINSLFYNINKRSVEDLTSQGIKDLKAGIIRTPLPPKETFLDDPLRVMRAVRFGARFGFKLDDELKKAASCDEVKSALGHKVSRERIGKEGEERRLFYLSSLLLPLRNVTASNLGKKGVEVSISELIIKESLKLKSDDAKKVLQLHSAAEQFVELTEMLLVDAPERTDEGFQSEKRVRAGLLLGEIKGMWRLALVLSSVLSIPLDETSSSHLTERTNSCLIVEATLLRLGLEKVWDKKPLFDGKKVMSLLGLTKGGPQVKEWMTRFHKWELAHPEGTEEQCLEWFQGEHVKRLKSS
uniref:Poly A polymerase head domain-containing protein n=1 Tax=Physcomitrium patens TaxID=3218 RepID=A0A7I4DW91_PHYPA